MFIETAYEIVCDPCIKRFIFALNYINEIHKNKSNKQVVIGLRLRSAPLRQITIHLELVEVACPEQISELCELCVEGLPDLEFLPQLKNVSVTTKSQPLDYARDTSPRSE